MGILVTERWSDRSLQYSWPLSGWRATRGFDVAYAGDEATALAAVAGQFAVYQGASFDLNPLLVCQTPRAVRAGQNFWKVTAQYIVPPGGVIPPQLDPRQWPFRIIWLPGLASEPTDTVYDDKEKIIPIVNAVGDPIDPPPYADRKTLSFQIRKYLPAYDPTQARKYMNMTNSDTFTVRGQTNSLNFDPYQVRCNCIRPLEEYQVDAKFVLVLYEFEFRPDVALAGDGWDMRIANRGWNGWYDGGGGALKKDRFYRGMDPVTEPVYLDLKGLPLTSNSDVQPITVGPCRAMPVANPSPVMKRITTETLDSGVVVLHYSAYKSIAFSGVV